MKSDKWNGGGAIKSTGTRLYTQAWGQLKEILNYWRDLAMQSIFFSFAPPNKKSNKGMCVNRLKLWLSIVIWIPCTKVILEPQNHHGMDDEGRWQSNPGLQW
jgi:hypothetical protein